VIINLSDLADRAFAEACRRETEDLARRGQDVLTRIDALMMRSR
jgi:formiminotetrahydrofolate cyclodeaminase